MPKLTSSKNTLNKYAKNIHSQFGEDGILEYIFLVMKTRNPWCVEFGAWDGIAFSNTRAFIENGWNGVLIEPNPRKFKVLQKNNAQFPKVHLLQEFVQFEGSNSLDNLLQRTEIPKSFDLLSIDIDGNDYHIWESVQHYTPKVVVIEFNATIPHDIEFIQEKNFAINQGTSLLALNNLAKKKKYELVCCTEWNAIFVHQKYFPLLKIKDNSIEALHTYKYLTRVFQLYDGTIKIEGTKKLLWSDIPFDENDIQILPRFFRHFPEGYTNIAKLLFFKHWRRVMKNM